MMATPGIVEKKVGSIIVYPRRKKKGAVRGFEVFEGTYNGNPVAVKRIERELLDNDIQITPQDVWNHENIAPYLAKEETDDFTYLAMNLCAGNLENFVRGELQGLNIGLTTGEVLYQMAQEVQELHSRGYVHGNLKPRNVLIAQLDGGRMTVKLADFQYRRNEENPEDDWWRAQETREPTHNLNAADDVFSLGCLFCYALTNGSHPFGEETARLGNIETGHIDLQTLEKIGDGALKELVKVMINREPSSRPSILTVINSPALAIESSTMQLRGLSLSKQSNRIPRQGVPIGESASIGVEVYETWMGKEIRAIKKINVSLYPTNYRKEVDILTKNLMSHCQYLVRYFSHEEDEGRFCYIEMERCNASLKYYIETKNFAKRVNNRETRRLFQKNIVEGVEFLHSDQVNLIHRDIKPSNILICEDRGRLIPKISDYSISEPAKSNGLQSTILQRGTDGWRAPEIKSLRRFSKAVDCFALGCLLFYIETDGAHPFNHPQLGAIGQETQRNIDKYTPNCETLSHIEPTLQDIICKALEKKSEDRISANQMLIHPAFFTNKGALDFLREVDERILTAGELDTKFKSFDSELVNIVIGDDWRKNLENAVLQEIATGPKGQRNNKIERDRTHGTSISNLVHLIRNKYAHFVDMNLGAREIIGEPPDKYFEYWHKKFPHLLIAIWNVTKREKLPQLILEIHGQLKKKSTSAQAERVFNFGNLKIQFKRKGARKGFLSSATTAASKTAPELFHSRTRPQLFKKKSYFEFLTDFPLDLTGRLSASQYLENVKKEMVYRLRHRLDIGVDDASTPVDEDHKNRSTYEVLLELIDDYDPSAICEIFHLLLESRFTVPLFNPLTNESYLPLFLDIQSSAVPNEPPITLGYDTRLSRVVLASCRSPDTSQSIDLLKDLFSLDTLHRNDLFDKSLTSLPLVIDVGVGCIGKADEQYSVLVVHMVGKFDQAAEFIKDFADVLLVEDTPKGEKTVSFADRCDKGIWNSKSMLTLLWIPGTSNRLETHPFHSVEMQYGSRLIGTLVSKMRHHFNDSRRLKRKDLSEIKLLEELSTSEYPNPTAEDQFKSIVGDISAARGFLKLQRNFREQATHEEGRREHRLDEDKIKLYDKDISSCINSRKELASTVGKSQLLLHFRDLLCDQDQGRRVTKVRRLEQYLLKSSESELQANKEKIDQLYAQSLRSGLNEDDRNRLREEYVLAKSNYRESILHIEHVWRELSHLYVADPLKYDDLPRLAAQHLLDGFSLELLDGDANLLNLPWIQSIFDNLGQQIGTLKRRIFVLSVMGVQSSGKSTLLNTMFGIKLKTSVGQCTRGINMQLVPVSDRDEYDYVLILDTEGMRSPDYHGIEGNEKRDNQMATLSVLLADATVVVNPGENDTAIKEVLPIVLMAYERSKLAEKSRVRLGSMMFFVYNRIDTMQSEKLSNIIQTLNDCLGDAFKKIGSSFGRESCLFRNFHLDVSGSSDSDVRILGNNKISFVPPNNVPDPAYGTTLAEFREHIHRRVTCGSAEWKCHSPNELSTYLGNIWECICSADFSIQFKHVLDMMNFDQLEAEYQETERALVSRYRKKFADVQKNLEKEASIAGPVNAASNDRELYTNLQVRLKDAMNKVIADFDRRFLRAVEQTGRDQWRPLYEQRWKLYKEKQEDYWCCQLRYSYDANITYEFQVEELKSEMRRRINAEIAERRRPLGDKELRADFERMMNEFVDEAKRDYPPLDVNQCVNNFYAMSPTIRSQHISLNSSDLDAALETRQSRDRNHLENDFFGWISKHWPGTPSKSFDDMSFLLQNIQDKIGDRLDSVRVYDDSVVSYVIKDTEDAINSSKKTEFWQRELAHAFARSYLIHRMERIQKNWEARNLVGAKFNRQTNWTAMWEYYRTASQGAEKIKLFMLLLSERFSNLQKAYQIELVTISIREIKKRFGNSYWVPDYMNDQLVHVLQSNQLNYLFDYMKNPNELQIQVLREMLRENVVYAISHVKTWHQFVKHLSGCVSRATACALKPGRGTRATRFVASLRTGLARNLTSNALTKSNDRNLSSDFDQLDEVPKSEFREECNRALKKLIHEQRDPSETYHDFVDQVTVTAINELWQNGGLRLRCQHCCPCCGSMCVREAGHSASDKHDTNHQPAGLFGWRLGDGSLDWRTCYDLKPADRMVRGTRRFVFRDWSAVFPEWKQPADRLGNRNALSEYIFYNYQYDLAQYYNAKQCTNMPPQYNRNWNDVLCEVHQERNFSWNAPTAQLYNRGYSRKYPNQIHSIYI